MPMPKLRGRPQQMYAALQQTRPSSPASCQTAHSAAARSAVKAAAASWGERSLELLEAEDRLSVACEKGNTEDQVLLKLRAVYQVGDGALPCGVLNPAVLC